MDKDNYLIDDFKQVSQKSDDTVFELLKAKEKGIKPTGNKKTLPEKRIPRTPSKASKSNDRTTPTKKPTAEVKVPESWGKPTTILNTRIPPELSALIDDHVYRSKKQGKPMTKQTIATVALTSFLLHFSASSAESSPSKAKFE